MDKQKMMAGLLAVAALILLSGCAHSRRGADVDTSMADLQQELEEKQDRIADLESTVKDQDRQLTRLEDEIKSAEEARERAYDAMDRTKSEDMASGDDLFPPARVGECYTRVFVPATYEKVTEEKLMKEATSVVEVIPAKYEWVEEEVLVKEASSKLETVPAEYRWEEEEVLVKEAHTVWKKGRGPIEKIDESTGEIICLVEVPAQYKTVKKRVEVSPATTRTVAIPAKYETVKVRKMVESPREVRKDIPAEYQTVTRWVKQGEGHMAWRQVLCETNMSRDLVSRIQSALKNSGHDPGPIDGIIGNRTSTAVRSYQKSQGLAVGALTHETITKLGVRMGS